MRRQALGKPLKQSIQLASNTHSLFSAMIAREETETVVTTGRALDATKDLRPTIAVIMNAGLRVMDHAMAGTEEEIKAESQR